VRAFRKKFAEWGVKREDLERSRTALSSNSQTPDSDAIANNSGTFPSGIQQEDDPAARAIGVADEGDNTVYSNARTRQIYYGGLVIELQQETEECNRLKQELEAARGVLPDTDALKAEAEEAEHRVMELERLLEKALEEAKIAHDALEASEKSRERVETAARDLDEKMGELEQKRSMLRIG
jgi:hypothetical protein